MLAETLLSVTPTEQTVRPGESTWMRVDAPVDGQSFQWYRGETGDTAHPVAGATAALLVSPPIRDETRYWCRITTPETSIDSHAAIVTPQYPEEGYVLAGSGDNTGTKLGLPNWQNYITRHRPLATHVIAAAGTYRTTYYLKTDNTLYSQGAATIGGTPLPAAPPQLVAEAVAAFATDGTHVAVIRHDGSLWLKNRDVATATDHPFLPIAPLAVSANINYGQLYYITPDATLMSLGVASASQTTAPATPVEIARGVAAAESTSEHKLILKTDGTLWGEGQNTYGALGPLSASFPSPPTMIAADVVRFSTSTYHTLFVRGDGSLWVMGDSGAGMASAVPEMRLRAPRQVVTPPVREINAASSSSSFWIDVHGTLWGAGGNYSGELGDGSALRRAEPVRIAEGAVALATLEYSSCSLYLGRSHRVTFDPAPHGTRVGGGALVQHVLHGHPAEPPIIEATPGYAVADWGASYSAVTASLALTARYVAPALPAFTRQPEPQTVRALTNAVLRATAVDDAPLTPIRYQWYRGAAGDTSHPVIGANSPILLTLPLPQSQSFWVRASNATGHTDSSAAWVHVASPSPDYPLGRGRLDRYTKQLSSIKLLPENVATPTSTNGRWLSIDTDLRLWIPSLSPLVQPVLVAENVVSAAVGYEHTIFLKSDGTLWGYGENSNGQLGDGTRIDRNTPIKISEGVAAIAAGYNQSFMIKTDGTLWAFGQDMVPLGVPQSGPILRPAWVADNVTAICTTTYITAFIQNDGRAWCMGLGLPIDTFHRETALFMPQPLATSVTSVSIGRSNIAYVTADHTLWAIGSNRPSVEYTNAGDVYYVPRRIATDALDAVINHDGSVAYRNTSGELRYLPMSYPPAFTTLTHDVADYGFENDYLWILSPTRQVIQRLDPRAVTGASERTAVAFLGAAPPAPVTTARTGWRFAGWQNAPERILEDTTLTARYLSPFAQWATSQNLSDSAPHATPYGDGIPNLLTYALGRPTAVNSSTSAWATLHPRLSTPSGEPNVSFTHRRRKSALAQITYEQSHDLANPAGWQSIELSPTVISTDADGDDLTELVEVTLPTPPEPGRPVFLRLRVAE